VGIKPIALSFKNTREDMELYTWIISHSNLSGFIKDTLRATMNKDNVKEVKNGENLIDLNV
jgi:hypothetical protein